MTVLQDVDVWGSHGPKADKIVVADMVARSKLLSVDEVRERLSATEPLEALSLPASAVDFRLENDWNREAGGIEPVEAYLRLGDNEYQMTKDALLEATTAMGLNKAYVQKSPAALITPQLKYWYKGGFDLEEKGKEYKALVVQDKCQAITRVTINPFSNLRLLDESLAAIENRYGKGEVYVDPKFEHSLRRTHLRLIVPEYLRTMEGTDVEDDNWSIGVQVLNSLIGEFQTEASGYMFRWWCTNGAIDTFANSSKWSRKAAGGQSDSVYGWAREAVDEVLGGLEHSLDLVQATTEIPVGEEASDVLKEIFDTFQIPGAARQLVTDNMVNSDDLTIYGIMQAITAAANSPEVDPAHILGLMQCGGSLPHIANERCGACKRFVIHAH